MAAGCEQPPNKALHLTASSVRFRQQVSAGVSLGLPMKHSEQPRKELLKSKSAIEAM
jgi:hypothetical protein